MGSTNRLSLKARAVPKVCQTLEGSEVLECQGMTAVIGVDIYRVQGSQAAYHGG